MIERRERDRMPDILMFIGRFSHDHEGPREQVYDAFLHGGCYWFAYILRARFGGEIMIDLVENHFACLIDGRVYDITGDVTEGYHWQSWDSYDDDIHKKRIDEYCINF